MKPALNRPFRSSELPAPRSDPTPAFLPRAHLVNTKLRPPQVASALIARDDLLATLDRATAKKLLLLVAQIGSGKTTLLSQWHQRSRAQRAIAWLSLDEHDNDPRSFFSYLIAAVRCAVPAFEAYITGALQDDANLPLALVNAVFLESLGRIERPLVIVLDDFQWITDAGVLRAFRYLLQHAPAHVHWVVSSRRALDLPLSQLKLQDQLAVLGTRELNLAVADICELSLAMHGRSLAAGDADYIHGCTEGWVAGAKLALLSVSEPAHLSQGLRRFSGSSQEVASYLAGAVLLDQPAPMREFLLASALVDKMTGDLCNALLGISNSDELLERLEQSQLFVQALDNHRHWYRYHLLFLDFLRSQLLRDHAERIPQLHRTASQWFAEHQMHEEALVHAFASGDRAWCVEVTARCAWVWMKSGEMFEIQRWAARLSPAEILGHDELCCACILSLVLSRRFAEAAEMLQRARARWALCEEMSSRLQLLSLVLRADTADPTEPLDDELPARGDTDAFFNGILMTTQTTGLLGRNQFDAARRMAMRAREVCRQTDNLYVLSYSETLIGVADRAQGRCKAASETCERIFELVKGAPKSPMWVNAAVALACARYEQNRLAEAQALCVELLPLISAASVVENFVTPYVVLARLKAIQGQREEAFQLLDCVHSVLENGGPPRYLAQVCFEKVRLLLEQNNLERAQAIARDFGLPAWAERGEWAAVRTYDEAWGRYGLAQALLWLHERRHGECRALLRVLRDSAQQVGYVYRQLPLELALGLCEWKAGQEGYALELLNRCLALTQRLGFGRGVFDEVPGLPALLGVAAAAGKLPFLPTAKYFKQFTADKSSRVAAAPAKPLLPLEPLTEREIVILKLVSKGYCNKAISEASCIALSTTKWHLRNAFAKLDVNSRTGAIARARELHLID